MYTYFRTWPTVYENTMCSVDTACAASFTLHTPATESKVQWVREVERVEWVRVKEGGVMTGGE